jgi:hypothetical protein
MSSEANLIASLIEPSLHRTRSRVERPYGGGVAPGPDEEDDQGRPITGGLTMCHDWWLKRRFEEAEGSRRMWDEFERTRPLSDPEVAEDAEPEFTLAKPEPARLASRDAE